MCILSVYSRQIVVHFRFYGGYGYVEQMDIPRTGVHRVPGDDPADAARPSDSERISGDENNSI